MGSLPKYGQSTFYKKGEWEKTLTILGWCGLDIMIVLDKAHRKNFDLLDLKKTTRRTELISPWGNSLYNSIRCEKCTPIELSPHQFSLTPQVRKIII